MAEAADKNYRLADCCDTCQNCEEEYSSSHDIFYSWCLLDGKKVGAPFVCDKFVKQT